MNLVIMYAKQIGHPVGTFLLRVIFLIKNLFLYVISGLFGIWQRGDLRKHFCGNKNQVKIYVG